MVRYKEELEMKTLKRKEFTEIRLPEKIPDGYFRDNQAIERVRFIGIKFDGDKFQNSLLKGCEFLKCTFSGCIFDRMDLQRVWFRDCIFTQCLFSPDFRYITGEFTESSIIDCDFPASFIQNVKWIKCKLENCNFRNLKAKSITFLETSLPGIVFDNANIVRGDFKSVPGLRRETFYNVKLDDCEFAWNEVFVVMEFGDPQLDNLFNYGIEPVLKSLGVEARRVDRYEFKGRITDEILQNIVTARVVVAECSAPNKNVFFEVGFALGRAKEVVFLVDEADNIPFDLKDYKFLIHQKSIDSLKNQLRQRMCFLLGIEEDADN
jgi:uncharacterized protein YjbI with pentapeptide repeats